jgi:hypothetical protein
VVYEKRFFSSLINVFNENLQAKGQVILSEPNRKIAQEFFTDLVKEGYRYQDFAEKVTLQDKVHQSTIYLIEKDI